MHYLQGLMILNKAQTFSKLKIDAIYKNINKDLKRLDEDLMHVYLMVKNSHPPSAKQVHFFEHRNNDGDDGNDRPGDDIATNPVEDSSTKGEKSSKSKDLGGEEVNDK